MPGGRRARDDAREYRNQLISTTPFPSAAVSKNSSTSYRLIVCIRASERSSRYRAHSRDRGCAGILQTSCPPRAGLRELERKNREKPSSRLRTRSLSRTALMRCHKKMRGRRTGPRGGNGGRRGERGGNPEFSRKILRVEGRRRERAGGSTGEPRVSPPPPTKRKKTEDRQPEYRSVQRGDIPRPTSSRILVPRRRDSGMEELEVDAGRPRRDRDAQIASENGERRAASGGSERRRAATTGTMMAPPNTGA